MAVYKVPQDVEADDKLIGPFSFRQFIYLIIVALAGAMAWGLAQIFILLVVIPLPIILFFGALALPLRKDQPMEIYLAAIVSFYLKPHRRLWDPDGIDTLIEITAPKILDAPRTKDITQEDADQRFAYLAEVVDSQGWSVRGGGAQAPNSAMNTDVYYAAQQTQDVLDSNNTVAQSFDYMMTASTERLKKEAMERMRQAPTTPQPAPMTPPVAAAADPSTIQPTYNPYPTSINQTVLQPVDDPAHQFSAAAYQAPVNPPAQTAPTTSDNTVSADIMNLANNTDLSIETIAREAHRIQEKNDASDEVVISLR